MKATLCRSALLLMLCTMGCGRYVARHVEQGDRYYKQQQFQEAISEYVKAVRLDDSNEHLLRQLGLSSYQVGNLKDAFTYLSRVELLEPSDWEVKVVVGRLYLLDHKPDQALREAQAVLASQPANTDALSLLGSVYMMQKHFTNAVEVHRRLVALLPSASDRHYALGVALLGTQQDKEAKKEFETALLRSPGNVEALTRVLNMDLLAGRTDDALTHIEKQIATSGRKPKLLLMLASVQAVRGDQTAAERTYREALRLDPGHAEARLALADFYVKAGRLEQAKLMLDSALAVEKTASGYQLQGILFQMAGNTESARQSYDRALAVDSGYAPAANNLAWLLSEKLGDNRGAYTAALTAYRVEPDDPHIQDTFGWILHRAGDDERAVTMLTSSAKKLRGTPGVQYHLAMALLTHGDTAEARRSLTIAVKSPLPFDDRAAAKKTLATLR